MIKQGLYRPLPARPFYGYSVAKLICGTRRIKSPTWFEVGTIFRRKHATAHSCSLDDFFKPIMEQVENDLENDLKNLSLDDLGLKSVADSAYRKHIDSLAESLAASRVASVWPEGSLSSA